MDAFARLLQLLALLQRQPTWSSDVLAERLGVTPRTVRRDIARLRDLGYVVDAAPGRHGGYRLAGGQALPPLALTDDEAVAAAVALRDATGSGVARVDEAAVTALAKLEQVLPVRLRERVRAVVAATEQLGGGAAATVEPDLLVVLADACLRRERLRCAYTDRRGRRSRRDIEPYRLVQAQRRWYLVAFDRGRRAWRTFRADRLSEAQPQGVLAPARELPDAAALVAEAITSAPYRWRAVVRLAVSHEHAAHMVPPTVGTLSPAGEATVLRIGADDLRWLAHFLVGLGVRFDVLEPAALRTTLVELAADLVAAFGPPADASRAAGAGAAADRAAAPAAEPREPALQPLAEARAADGPCAGADDAERDAPAHRPAREQQER